MLQSKVWDVRRRQVADINYLIPLRSSGDFHFPSRLVSSGLVSPVCQACSGLQYIHSKCISISVIESLEVKFYDASKTECTLQLYAVLYFDSKMKVY